MIRRTLHALAALTAAALLVLGPGVPAHADPEPVKPLCTVEEWQVPANFLDCAHRLGNAAARRADCVKAPTPASPDSGISGWLSRRPDADLRPGVLGQYARHGMAGYPLDMYDTSCAGAVTHPTDTGQNAIAGMEFSIAQITLGTANGLRELAYDPHAMWGWSDSIVRTATEKTYDYVFSVLGALALAAAGGWLIWRARLGRLSEATKLAGWALLVMVAVTGIGKYPLLVTHGADRVAVTGLSAMHEVVGPGSNDIPLEDCASRDRNPDACKDHRTVAVRSSDAAVYAILYRNWVRAMLGCDDCPIAKKYGPALYDATTITWGEAADIDAHPELRPVIVQAKAEQWISIAEAVKAEDPEAYEHLQGLHGDDRLGSGFIAMLSAGIYSIFDIGASVVILLGFLVVRVAVMTFPLMATIGILQPGHPSVMRLFNAVVGSVANIIMFGAGAGLYLWIVDSVFDSDLSGFVQISAVGLTGVVLWMVLRPVKRLVRVGARKRDEEDEKPGLLYRLLSFAGQTVKDAREAAPSSHPASRPRPETTAGNRA
ncbi:MFS transporter [Dactylosporangium sp. CA-139066]|uniref:MFS transporter n=1 Tax=Dactylosporangium sp. CA-139066 TaxID=3239930 RepID=UPI003D931753